jgi:hypothetical protein
MSKSEGSRPDRRPAPSKCSEASYLHRDGGGKILLPKVPGVNAVTPKSRRGPVTLALTPAGLDRLDEEVQRLKRGSR